MKVCLVNKFHYRKGGSETYYFTIAEALQAHRHEVIFFSMKDDKNVPCLQEQYFVSNASVNGGIKSKLNMVLHIAYSKEAYAKMRKLLEEESPDLLLLNLIHKQITLSILDAVRDYRAESGKKVLVFWTMHDLITVCPSYTMLDGGGRLCEECLAGSFAPCVKNRCIKGSFLMSVLSKYEADYIRKRNWYNEVDLYICPSEFYGEKLKGNGRDKCFTKSRIVVMRNPLPVDTKYEHSTLNDGYILYVGRLSKEKGVKTLIDASVRADVRLVIVGTGKLENELKEYAGKYNTIQFRGFQTGEDLKNSVRKCHCIVLPSEWYENGPYSAMEAMALGKPLIVSDRGGLPELVEDGINGYVYSGGSEALEKCIRRICGLSEKAYQAMAKESLNKARRLFDPDQYVTEIEKYFDTIRNF